MKYQELKEGIGRRLNSAAEDFFTVGYYLRQISEGALFLEDGYESIWDFAKSEFNLSTASASRFMAINSKFSIDGGRTMEPKYIGMGVSRLQEMLTLPDEDLERVTTETTVREIRAMKAAKKKPLSFFGWPETERPEPPQIIDADAADYMEIGDPPQDAATGPAVPACEPLEAEPEEVPAEEPKAPTEAQEPPQESAGAGGTRRGGKALAQVHSVGCPHDPAGREV